MNLTVCVSLPHARFRCKRSVLMLCAPVFIFTSGRSVLLGRPRCGLSILLSLLAILNTLSRVYAKPLHEKTDKTRKYWVSHFPYDTKMATDGYWARKALILRAFNSAPACLSVCPFVCSTVSRDPPLCLSVCLSKVSVCLSVCTQELA